MYWASMLAARRRCACLPTIVVAYSPSHTEAGANLQASGELAVEKVLHQVMEDTLAHRDVRPDAICLGIAGVDRPNDAQAVQGIMRRIGFKARVTVVNDALVALVAGAGEQAGVVIVAGTGSIAYGVDASKRACRAGGWGYLLGDEGGGYWIGRAALSAVVRAFDGRGPATRLTELVLAEMHLATPSDLIHAIYDRGLQRPLLAGLAAVVQEAMLAGDAVASDILARAAEELVGCGGISGDTTRDARRCLSDDPRGRNLQSNTGALG